MKTKGRIKKVSGWISSMFGFRKTTIEGIRMKDAILGFCIGLWAFLFMWIVSLIQSIL